MTPTWQQSATCHTWWQLWWQKSHPQKLCLWLAAAGVTSREGSGDPTLWAAICSENREAIENELKKTADELERLRQLTRCQ